jgi:dTDP-4-amino-4,6-dideoxygalactose transaminase
MTEFAATLGRTALSKLEKQNRQRIWAAEYLYKKLIDVSWVKVRISRSNEKGVYHAVALEFNLENSIAIKILNEFSEYGVPMRKLFDPLNKHPHFSSSRKPPRGYPWLDYEYNGIMKNVKYEELDLPVTYKFCYGKILELYTHPGIKKSHLNAFVHRLKSLHKKYVENSIA